VIVGIAQLVVNVADLAHAEHELRDAGFRRSFGEDSVPRHTSKRPLQSRARTALAMAHYEAPSAGTAIELTMYHGGPPGGATPYRLALPAAEPGVLRGIADDVIEGEASDCPAAVTQRGTGAERPSASGPSWAFGRRDTMVGRCSSSFRRSRRR